MPLADGDAYAVQEVLTAGRLAAGETVVGWKRAGAEVTMRTSAGREARTLIGPDLPDPADGVAWLLRELDRGSTQVPEGALVLTGGLLAPLALPDGGWAEATLAGATARITWRMEP